MKLLLIGLAFLLAGVGLYFTQMTEPSFQKITYQTSDSVTITADFYPGSDEGLGRPPVVILVHMLGRDRKSWGDFPTKLQEKGLAVLALDLRGHGESVKLGNGTISYENFNEEDWSKIDIDLHTTLEHLQGLKVNLEKIFVVGASIGANEAMIIGAETDVQAVVLLSPGENYRGIKTYPAAEIYAGRPALVVSSSEDSQSYVPSQEIVRLIGSFAQFVGLSGAGHGTDMLSRDSNLSGRVISFIEDLASKPTSR